MFLIIVISSHISPGSRKLVFDEIYFRGKSYTQRLMLFLIHICESSFSMHKRKHCLHFHISTREERGNSFTKARSRKANIPNTCIQQYTQPWAVMVLMAKNVSNMNTRHKYTFTKQLLGKHCYLVSQLTMQGDALRRKNEPHLQWPLLCNEIPTKWKINRTQLKKSKEIYTVEKYRLTHPLKIKTNKTFLAMTRNQQQK